jgi:beta-lactamase regulating signal transducer with metallopeptidase domain
MTVFAWLVALTLRATAILVASIAFGRFLRRAGADARHRLFTLTAVGLLALPALIVLLPRWEVPLLPAWLEESRPPSDRVFEMPRTDGAQAAQAPEAVRGEQPEPSIVVTAAAVAPAETRSWPWARAVVTIWLLGVLGNLLGLARGLRRERRLVAAAHPLDGGWSEALDQIRQELALRGEVTLRASDAIQIPSTRGFLRPAVLLPSAAVTWPAERQRVVLQHELVHVLRGDALRHFLWRLVSALYWFHPLARGAFRRASGAREEACDEAVLQLGNRPSVYARHLLEIAELLRGERRAPALALAMIDHGQLERRLKMILDPQRLANRGRLRTGLAVAALGLVLFGAAAAVPLVRAGSPVVATPATSVTAVTPVTAVATAGRESAGSAETACLDGIHGSFEGTFTSDGPSGTEMTGIHDGHFALQQHLGEGQRLCARVHGAVRFDDHDGSIVTLPRDSSVLIETRDGRKSQRMLVTEEQGQARYQWQVNGEPRAVDAAAQGWLRDALLVMDSYRAIGALQGHVGSLQGEIGEIQGHVGSLQGEIGSIQGEEGSLQGTLGEIQGEQGTLLGEIGSEQGEIGSLQGRRWQANEAQQRRIDKEIARHEAAIRKIEAEIARRRFPDRIAAAEKEIRTFADVEGKGRIAEINRRLQEVQAPKRIAEIERQIEDLHAEDRIQEIEQRMRPVLERLKTEVRRIAGL